MDFTQIIFSSPAFSDVSRCLTHQKKFLTCVEGKKIEVRKKNFLTC
jgi:hypothetical protein